ncbi:MAG TPA: glycosyltransferase [Solirubrobacteraceae bacterium]|nr:glycosyltransferase [Solirubrobacteraceae bacterium]
MLVVVAAHEEADRIGATLAALREAFPHASLWVADDGSRDRTSAIARAAGAKALSTGARQGKGGAMTLAVGEALSSELSSERSGDPVVLLCDGDLGASAARLRPLVQAVQRGDADLAVACFASRAGGGFGILVGFARWAIDHLCGRRAKAPLCGQRAFRASEAPRLLPFAPGYGMELGMTVDAVRAGMRVQEIELDLAHRVTTRTPAGFAHRGRQLLDCLRVYAARR